MDLVTKVYQVSSTFPKEEIYGLTNQFRRSAVSVPSNIAEGSARQSNKEYIQFLYIALGSLMELETQLIISGNIKLLSDKDLIIFQHDIEAIGKMLNGLIKYRKSIN